VALIAQGKNPAIRHNQFRDRHGARDEDDLPCQAI
jgi:hypothetical protein